jgi:general secretion pathway protein C
MEKLFRKQFWLFHVAFLALTAWLAARAVNTGVGAMLKAELTAAVSDTPKKGPARARTRNFDAATDANVFNARREKVEEQVPGAGGCKDDSECERGKCEAGACVEGDPKNDMASAVPTELRVRLVGTAVFTDPEFSLASIIDEGGGRGAESELYSINSCPEAGPTGPDGGPSLLGAQKTPCNELLDSSEVRLIDADRVYIFNKNEERFEYIELGKQDKNAPRVAARKPDKPKSKSKRKNKFADELGEHIKKTGDNQFEVEQEGVNKALGDLSKLATQARIVPAFEGGEAVGFKLFSIRPGSLYSKVGIQNGDVIRRINGYELNSPDKALEVYQKLKDAKEISVDLKRRGKPMSMSYNIVQ